ncbi:hypothetical protein BST33_17140 [Mycolicibacter minnesotensis]|uniref:ATP/GTP-binding protein n=1 Tax=Mycolicibacter minnesotensis TaxID=1118379 RepID=A0AA91M2Q6_9MYCO|nr:hypothetical protein [Mycolicibacter minnesotensis]ORA98208.1 hypothetical protein BST33_17140 [Mycolicibacter minnesotensis]
MARRRSSPRRQQPSGPLPLHQRVEAGPDGYDYIVVPIAGSRARKVYRCPGCDHEIRCGIAHVVVWLAGFGGSARFDAGEAKPGPRHGHGDDAGDDRRHWHTPCWANRNNRSPTRKWS